MLLDRNRGTSTQATLFAGALCAAAIIATPTRGSAAGPFDFLFGGSQQQTTPPVNSYVEAPPPISAAPARRGRVIGGSGGRFVAFCVRLCDGQHFPIERLSRRAGNATPVEICRAMCPTAKTKIFFGAEIGRAVAPDGSRYANLDNAYVYRDHLVANCTCNGKDALGLTAIEADHDPTLRAGDTVVTANGPVSYVGRRRGRVAEFVPLDRAAVDDADICLLRLRLGERGAAARLAGERPAATAPPMQEINDRQADK